MNRNIQIVYKKDNGADEKTYYIDKHKKWLPQEFELDMILVQEQTDEMEREFVEVVRCKDCEHLMDRTGRWCSLHDGLVPNPDDYCAWGIRRKP